MNPDMESIIAFIEEMPDETADSILANYTRLEMIGKLRHKRDCGKHGWFTRICSNELLMESLKEHVEKGDMIDVINIAAMIMFRTKLFGDNA